MTQDQLHKARQTRWRQDGNALLTLDDAERWLADTPLCLYLPRRQHLPIPAPSFVEAIAGQPDPTPAPAQIAAASAMLARLVASGAVIALNLFGPGGSGSSTGFVGEQPDFLATPEALPYLYALQPERNPKRAPSTTGAARVSPLAAEAWKLLEREGALTAVELRAHLGREVTEAATLRALGELWHAMRVVPVPGEHGAPAHWELLRARHARELNIGSTQSQTTALSILVAFYLQSAVAASAEQAEIFLSPLASRSRIRDVLHGLSTTRQLASFPLHGEAQLYVEGTLPEIPEEEVAPASEAAPVDAGLEQNEPSFPEAAAATPERPSRKPSQRRPGFADRARSRVTPRERREPSPHPAQHREGGFRRPQRHGSGNAGKSSSTHPPRRDRTPEDRPRRERNNRFNRGERTGQQAADSRGFERRGVPTPGRASDRPPFRRDGNDRFAGRPPRREGDRPFRPAGDRSSRPPSRPSSRPFDKRAGEDRFKKRPSREAGGRPFRPRDASSPDRPPRRESASGERRPFRSNRPPSRPPSRPFDKRAGGDRFKKRPPREAGERPFRPRDASSPDRPPRREPANREGRSFSSNRPFDKRAGGDRFKKRPPREAGDRPFRPRDASSPDRPPRREPANKERRPFRPAGDRPGGFPKSSGGAGAPGKRRAFNQPGSGSKGKKTFRPAGKRPGGFAPPRRKPRGPANRAPESNQGEEG